MTENNSSESTLRVQRGSCLCGQVRYEVTGELKQPLNCHCSMCRKAHGTAFRTQAWVRAQDFRWQSGAELVSSYESSPGKHRTFCKVCGSNLITRMDAKKDLYGLPLGTLDTDPGIKPQLHIFVASKAPWFDIAD